jgi:hypothetical protein
MLRKSSSQAEATAQTVPEAGWKYLVRHPAFIKDLTRLHKSAAVGPEFHSATDSE